jgi:hypothetical protein
MTNDDDHITLKDAAEHFGHKVSTLWAENARGNLEIWKIGNKWHTSPAAIKEMRRRCQESRKARGFISTRPAGNGLSETDRISAARASLKQSLNGLKNSSRNTSGRNTNPSRQARHS